MRAVFIRHGHSTANAGVPSDDLALIELTELGRRQAADIAAAWTECPTLIVISPYIRTRQTAEPTIERFPGVPVEIWVSVGSSPLASERFRG
jgi:broad specificity phosphatase PhoE